MIDGDTFVARSGAATEKVRISQVDAPEKSQDYGPEAKTCLADILGAGGVSICRDGKDKYGRTIANVQTNSGDVATQLVSQGCAWAYVDYLEEGSNLPALEASARDIRVGLWARSSPVAPWDYRHGTVPVTVDTAGTTAIQVGTGTLATDWDRVFDWAEHDYPDYLQQGTSTMSTADGMKYRCYAGGTCIGYKDDSLYAYDGKTLTNIGPASGYIGQAQNKGF